MPVNDVYEQVARIHIACIDQGFLSSLGPRFLSLLYQSIDESENSKLIVARDQDRVIGFVAGTLEIRQVYRTLIRHWWRLFVALLPAMFSIRAIRRILEVLFYGKKRDDAPGPEVPSAELLSISVDREYRGRNHAESLYRQLIDFFRSKNVARFKIVAGESLAAAHRFYRKMGAQAAGRTEVHKGESSLVYIQEVL